MTELIASLETLHRLFTGRTVAIESIKRLEPEERRKVLQHLIDDGVTLSALPTGVLKPDWDVIQDGTGLPQKLRGAVHELTRNYAPNLVVDAVMLELPEDVRESIARAFLPVEPEPEMHRYELLDAETAEVLWSGTEPFNLKFFDYVGADGSSRRYQREGLPVSEFGPGAYGITSRTCYRNVEDVAEQEKPKPPVPEPMYTLLDEDRGELAKSDQVHPDIRVVNASGAVVNYTLVRTLPEYDARDETARMVALYRRAPVK